MRIAKNAVYDLISQGVIYSVSFFASIAISRILGREMRGVWFMTITANTVALGLSNLGVLITNTYHIGKDPQCAGAMHKISLLFVAISTAGFLLVMALAGRPLRAFFFEDVPTSCLVLAVALLPFGLYYMAWQGMMIGLGRILRLAKMNALFYVCPSVAVLVALLVAWKAGLSMEVRLALVLVLWAGFYVLMVAIMAAVAARTISLRVPCDWALFRDALKFGFKAYFGNVATHLMRRLDTLFLNHYGVLGRVGDYSVAVGFADKFNRLPEALEKASYAQVTNASREEAYRLVQRLLRNFFFLGGCAVVLVWLLAYFYILLHGRQYAAATTPLRILAFGLLFLGGSRILAMYITGQRGKPHYTSFVDWLGLAINVPTLDFLTSRFGMNGAASATAITYAAHFCLFLLLFRREGPSLPWRDYFVINRADFASYLEFLRKLRARLTGISSA